MKKRQFVPPTPQMLAKIRKAELDVVGHNQRNIMCPYCRRRAIVVFDDASGHIQTRCKHCEKEVIIDLVNMRRIRRF